MEVIVNLNKQEDASDMDLKGSKLPSLDLTLSSSSDLDNEVENVYYYSGNIIKE